jgi:hypothetical protein
MQLLSHMFRRRIAGWTDVEETCLRANNALSPVPFLKNPPCLQHPNFRHALDVECCPLQGNVIVFRRCAGNLLRLLGGAGAPVPQTHLLMTVATVTCENHVGRAW